jgi:leader peptidase (prepilin peptidase)/N-methyltransferase
MDWVWPLLAAPFVGSFLGVLIARLPYGRPVVIARSACDRCGTTIMARDLMPLLSHVVLRGRCRSCSGRIAPRHWHVELAAVAIVVSALSAGTVPGRLWLDCALGWTLLCLAWIDWDSMTLPNVLTLPLIGAGLLATFGFDRELLTNHAVAAALGYTAFQGLAIVYRRLRGRDGLGQGDAKLLAALGAWIGLEGLPGVVFGAALAGLAAALLLSLSGRKMDSATAIPFGPCLALAGWVARLHS